MRSVAMFAYETRHSADDYLTTHRHRAPYASLVLDGCYVETSLDGPIVCSPGTVLLHPPFHAHGDRFGRRGALTVNVRLSFHSPVYAVNARIVRDVTTARGIFERAPHLLPELLTSDSAPAERSPQPSWHGAFVDALRDVDASAAKLAVKFGVSSAHACRALKRSHGMGPAELRAEWRWRRALALLMQDMSLAEVADVAGYADQSHFSRACRAISGETPGLLRSKLKSVQDSSSAKGFEYLPSS